MAPDAASKDVQVDPDWKRLLTYAEVRDQIIRDILTQAECPRARFKAAFVTLYGTGTKSPACISDEYDGAIDEIIAHAVKELGVTR